MTTVAFADVGQPVTGGTGVDPDIKTPLMADSDVTTVTLGVHLPVAVPNWAGALFSVHVGDPTEVDVDTVGACGPNIMPTAIASPFGPRSENVGSQAMMFTAWHMQASASGMSLPASQVQTFANMCLHAKNTDPIYNSDVDLTVVGWNIRHLFPGPGSTNLTLKPSDWVYGTPNWDPIEMSEFPTDPPEPGQGVWYHLNAEKIFHLPGGIGSAFYATLAGTATIGIEHIPEPASGLMVLGGIAGLIMGHRARRRRVVA
jgi:hypothetical protein